MKCSCFHLSVCLSICPSHTTAACRSNGFAAVGLAARRYLSIATWLAGRWSAAGTVQWCAAPGCGYYHIVGWHGMLNTRELFFVVSAEYCRNCNCSAADRGVEHSGDCLSSSIFLELYVILTIFKMDVNAIYLRRSYYSVMYFWFHGWHHVCTQWPGIGDAIVSR